MICLNTKRFTIRPKKVHKSITFVLFFRCENWRKWFLKVEDRKWIQEAVKNLILTGKKFYSPFSGSRKHVEEVALIKPKCNFLEQKSKQPIPEIKHGGGSIMQWQCILQQGHGSKSLMEWRIWSNTEQSWMKRVSFSFLVLIKYCVILPLLFVEQIFHFHFFGCI